MYCPVLTENHKKITIAHGGGGELTHRLIDSIFRKEFDNAFLAQGHDAAILPVHHQALAMTTDSYVLQPIFFPGGDIGKLSICGTVNDLLVSGAIPKYISCGFIIEEGFSIADLYTITKSMSKVAIDNHLNIVTGDTKVVERQSDNPNIFINTTGIGEVYPDTKINPDNIQNKDAIIISGDIGRHAIAIMAMREGLEFEVATKSDCAALTGIIKPLLQKFPQDIHCMRDLTRGGLATACIELAEQSDKDFIIDETSISVEKQVDAACELLGLSPLYCANEGRFMLVVAAHMAEQVVDALNQLSDLDSHPAGIIGEVNADKKFKRPATILKTPYGTNRKIIKQSGEQLPRIC